MNDPIPLTPTVPLAARSGRGGDIEGVRTFRNEGGALLVGRLTHTLPSPHETRSAPPILSARLEVQDAQDSPDSKFLQKDGQGDGGVMR